MATHSIHYSCLENPMDRGAWRAIVHRVAESNMTEVTWHACHVHAPTIGAIYTVDSQDGFCQKKCTITCSFTVHR